MSMSTTIKVYTGKSVTRCDSQLSPLTLERLCEIIKNPEPGFLTSLERLRTLQTINQTAYREEKKQLPFFTCGSFVPPIRHSKNFGSISAFVLDIDHLGEKELTIEETKKRLKDDERVVMAFASPGNDGVKVIIGLKSPCYDASLFSLFYRKFAVSFGRQHQFEQVIDKRTSDVTRACFLSYDPDVYFNPEAKPVKIEEWISPDREFSFGEEIRRMKEIEVPGQVDETEEQKGPDAEILSLIRKKLNPASKPPTEKNAYVPEELGPVTDELYRRIEEFNMQLADVSNIQYGRKLRFVAGQLWAELNVFYGKKGFSVVATPKRGSNMELAGLARKVIWQILSEMKAARVSE